MTDKHADLYAPLLLRILSSSVCCRIRPFNKTETDRGDEPAVELISEAECGVYNGGADWETYGFDQVWGQQSSQAQVFEQVEALALSVVDGFNACICCYGQTGSGKTFTMTGLPREGKPGISFQTMDKVFEQLNLKVKAAKTNAEAAARAERAELERRRKLALRSGGAASSLETRPAPPTGSGSKVTAFEWRATVSMLEIYNEEVRCLLAPAPTKKALVAESRKLDIKQGANGLMTVPGLVAQEVSTTSDVLDAFEQGNATRSVASTAMNATSSRSHMVLMVDVTTRTNEGAETTGRLYLVDLAGSERVAKSGVTGQAMKEAQGINKSLSALGDVMEALDKGQSHIPFRNSKLTFLLQSALGGSARCMFIFNASPAEGNSEETRCTFKFASRMRNISLGAAKKNVDGSGLEAALEKARREAKASAAELRSVQAEVQALRQDREGGGKADKAGDKAAAKAAETALGEKEGELAEALALVASLREQLASVEDEARELRLAPPPRRRPSSHAAAKDDDGSVDDDDNASRSASSSVARPPRPSTGGTLAGRGRGRGEASGGRGGASRPSQLSRSATADPGALEARDSKSPPRPSSALRRPTSMGGAELAEGRAEGRSTTSAASNRPAGAKRVARSPPPKR